MPGRVVVEGETKFFIPNGQTIDRQPGFDQLPEEFKNFCDDGWTGIFGLPNDGYYVSETAGKMSGYVRCTTNGFEPERHDGWISMKFNDNPPSIDFPGGVRIEPVTTQEMNREISRVH